MGWNTGYTIFEATVVSVYDLGKLDKEMLSAIMEPYRGTDIDSGGRLGIKAKDGKMVEQIVIETWGLVMPGAPACEYVEDPDAWESFSDEKYTQFSTVSKHFGWG